MKTWRGGGVQERAVLSSVASGARLSPCLYLSGLDTAGDKNSDTSVKLNILQKFSSNTETPIDLVVSLRCRHSGIQLQ